MKPFLALTLLAIAVSAGGLADAQAKGSKGSKSYRAPSYNSSPGYGTGSNTRSHKVAPSVRRDGAYVPGHQRSNPNNTQRDNWTTKGNTNPYTGKQGTRTPYR